MSGRSPGGPTGLLVVDKPAGPTSHDVVSRVRRLFGTRRVGHAGTLDPPATGVLLLGLGRATRVLPFLQALPKSYRSTVRFGASTTTQDAEGEVVAQRPCAFGPADLEREAAAFAGEILQVPPMISAVKVGGEPLYRAARRGEEVERPARPVTVYELTVESFDEAAWTATIILRCSSGTYVRTIAHDLGERLGCGGHVVALRRLAVGSFGEAEAMDLDAIEAMAPGGRLGSLLTPAAAMRDFPSVKVSGTDLEGVLHGRPLQGTYPGAGGAGPVAVLDPGGRLVAVYRRGPRGLQPAAVLA